MEITNQIEPLAQELRPRQQPAERLTTWQRWLQHPERFPVRATSVFWNCETRDDPAVVKNVNARRQDHGTVYEGGMMLDRVEVIPKASGESKSKNCQFRTRLAESARLAEIHCIEMTGAFRQESSEFPARF